MCDLGDISLPKLRLWSTKALKAFLSARKKKVTGSFDELVSRAFAALENNEPVEPDAEHRERVLLDEYIQKLKVQNDVYPDPFTITEGWQGEDEGRYSWPSVYINDISDYLQQTAACSLDLQHRLINEYKEGKAYRYFSCERVKEIQYHPVRQNSPFCYLKATVHGSMSAKKKYNVWVMAVKKGHLRAGAVQTAYCSCPAGLLGSCNHIAGVLFRVDAAATSGATQKVPTEKSCAWVIPRAGAGRKPQAVQDTVLAKDKYARRSSKVVQKMHQTQKQQFVPYNKAQADKLGDMELIRKELDNIVVECAPNSILAATRRREPPRGEPANDALPLPEDLISAGQKSSSVSDLLGRISLTSDEIEAVEVQTRSQSLCQEWHKHRCGRLTSSQFYSVYTRSTTCLKSREMGRLNTFADTFLDKSMTPTTAMKHGMSLEPLAKKEVTSQLRKAHKHSVVKESGLVVSAEHPYLAASPDLVTSCDCCGEGLVEIKCPFSVAYTTPTEHNIPYVERAKHNDQPLKLKKNHIYYGQIQGQLAITKRAFCILFVYTSHGSLSVKVEPDVQFWESMLQKLSWFWESFVAPKIVMGLKPTGTHCPSGDHASCSSSSAHTPSTSKPGSSGQILKGKRVLPVAPVHLCGVTSCGSAIVENPAHFEETSVKCDSCPQWYHMKCVGFVQGQEPTDDESWECDKCLSEFDAMTLG